MRIGAHMSVAGGVSKAVERAVVHGCEALQIFSKNANQWLGKPLDPAEVARFRQRVDETGITPVVSHASYLINLATTAAAAARAVDRGVRRRARSRRGARPARRRHSSGHVHGRHRRRRAAADRRGHRERLQGAAAPDRQWCCSSTRRARDGPSAIGSSTWPRSSAHLDGSPRVGVCLDTCHLVASGYDIAATHPATTRRSSRSSGSWDSIGSRSSTATTRRSHAAAASIATSTSARDSRPRTVSPAARRSALCRLRDPDRDGEGGDCRARRNARCRSLR